MKKRFIPAKRLKIKLGPPWITSEILHAIRQKESISKRLKHSRNENVTMKYKQLRSRVKRIIFAARENFLTSLSSYLKFNPKRLTQNILYQRRCQRQTPPA